MRNLIRAIHAGKKWVGDGMTRREVPTETEWNDIGYRIAITGGDNTVQTVTRIDWLGNVAIQSTDAFAQKIASDLAARILGPGGFFLSDGDVDRISTETTDLVIFRLRQLGHLPPA
jgi:hypothetical protein